ncbi:MAG: RNA polymerase sigma factor [Natronospirillum sp.]
MKTRGASPHPSAHAPDLALLLHRLQQRDHAALQRLYELTSARLMAVIMRILNDESDSADVLQELYLKLWQWPDRFVPGGSAWGWLCVVARHAALDHLKHRQRRREDALTEVEHMVQVLVNPTEALSLSEAGVDRCMAGLAEDPRRAILLSYLHGYSQHELVTVMQRPLGTIKSWLRRGLQELKQCLQS